MKILLAIPVIALVCAGVLWSLGVFNQEEDKPLPPVEPLPPIEPEPPEEPTVPDVCVEPRLVEIWRVDIGHAEVEEHHIPTLIYKGVLSCKIIDIYDRDITLEIRYGD